MEGMGGRGGRDGGDGRENANKGSGKSLEKQKKMLRFALLTKEKKKEK